MKKRHHSKLYTLLHNKLYAQVIAALILAVIFGITAGPYLRSLSYGTTILEWIALPGVLFIKLIQMIVIPLVIASIMLGIANIGSIKKLRTTGFAITIYFIVSTVVAITIGIILASLIQPGNYIDPTSTGDSINIPESTDMSVPNFLLHLFPDNIFSSLLSGEMLQIVIFSLIMGVALVTIPKRQSRPLRTLLESIQNVSMTVVKWAMTLAPLAVFGLTARMVSQVGLDTLVGMGIYVVTVLAGLLILLLLYLSVVFVISRRTPFTFLKDVRDAQLLAFSTSSSAAVMPVTIRVAKENLKLRESIIEFIVPIGATINMDGTAMYQAIATIFLAQVYNVDLSITALILLVATIVGASVGTPGTPGVGIAILAVIVEGAGIPLAGISLLLGVDRLLDMCRTTINVTGDLTAVVVMDKVIPGDT